MKKISDRVVSLIQRMTHSEKQYYRLHSSLDAGNANHLKLFEVFEKQASDKVVPLSDAETHNTLYDLLLKSLTSFHATKSPDFKLRNTIGRIEILLTQGLWEECLTEIEAGKKAAHDLELYGYLLEILQLERRYLLSQEGMEKQSLQFEENLQLEAESLTKLRNLHEYTQLIFQVSVQLAKEGGLRTAEDFEEFGKVSGSPLLSGIDKALSFEAKTIFYHCHILLSSFIGAVNRSYGLGVELVKLMDEHPGLLYNKTGLYVVALYNVLVCQFQLKKWEEFQFTIQQFGKITPDQVEGQPGNVQAIVLQLAPVLKLRVWNRTGKFQEALEISASLDQLFDPVAPAQDGSHLPIYFEQAICHFALNKFQEVEHYLQLIFAHPGVTSHPDIHSAARMMQLMVWYEQDEQDQISSALATANAQIESSNIPLNLEKEVNALFSQVLSLSTDQEKNEGFKTWAATDFASLAHAPDLSRPILGWIHAKGSGQSIESILSQS